LQVFWTQSATVFIAEPQPVHMIFYFAMLPLLPPLTPNGGELKINK
jgi:hypothetical protein